MQGCHVAAWIIMKAECTERVPSSSNSLVSLLATPKLCVGMNVGDPFEWYREIPPVSRFYLTASCVLTAACALDIISPFALYFNWKLIMKGQVSRQPLTAPPLNNTTLE